MRTDGDIKDTYGGEGSNYTVNRIITESLNILVYRNCIQNAERNYVLNGLTTARGKPDISATFRSLGLRMASELQPNKYIPGRRSGYTVQDTISAGVDMMVLDMVDGEEVTAEGESKGIEQNISDADLLANEM